MKNIAFVFIISVLFISCNNDDFNNTSIRKNFNITSSHTGTTYKISVFYPDESFPDTSVPVVYILDGFWWGSMSEDVVMNLTENNEIPKCIVISIDYKNGDGVYARSKDLIYPGLGVPEPAEANNFFQFLKAELIPSVENEFNCDTSRRIIFGHSLGGLFVLFAMLDNPTQPLFKNCIASSCSMGIGSDNYLFEKENIVSTQISDLQVKLFLGSGTFVGSSPAMHEEFYDRITSRGYPNLKAKISLYPEQHGTDAYPSFRDGIKYILTN
jgi:predicted alpha/beta superfamily hydrolase